MLELAGFLVFFYEAARFPRFCLISFEVLFGCELIWRLGNYNSDMYAYAMLSNLIAEIIVNKFCASSRNFENAKRK